MKLAKQITALGLVLLLFAAFHLAMYLLLTRRLVSNFGSTAQAQMVDVGRYLPHEEGSDLPHLAASVRLSGDLPVLDGAAALVPVYAAVIENLYPAGCVRYEGGRFSDDNYYGENFAADSAMQYNNTVRGYQAIVDGSTDLFFCAAPSREQQAYAEGQGAELVFVPIGLEAFVFFVNEHNPVQGLTTDQLRGIYAGEYTNWAEVGGPDRMINPVTRMEGSGSQTVFEAFMDGTPIGKKSLFAILGGSVGFSFRFYVEGMTGEQGIRLLALDGAYPSAENIQSGSYPLVVPFYAVYRADNDNPNLPLLIDWLLSEEGQEMIAQTGYLPLG